MTEQLERYLLRQSTPEERLVLEAQLLLHPTLRENLRWQQQTYDIIRQYGRQQLLHEIKAAERVLFRSPEHRGFRQKIQQLFSKT